VESGIIVERLPKALLHAYHFSTQINGSPSVLIPAKKSANEALPLQQASNKGLICLHTPLSYLRPMFVCKQYVPSYHRLTAIILDLVFTSNCCRP
jgi:hypothetical protein